MALLFSDPSLNVTTLNGTDLFPIIRQVVNSSGMVTGYTPQNIKASDMATALVTLGMIQLGATLPTTAPTGGGLWLNDGMFAYSAISGTVSGEPLSAAALAASIKSLLAASPSMGSTTNYNGFQNNAGVVTEVDNGN